jgi:hypothetical protein
MDGRASRSRFDGETAWLSLGQMAERFQRDKSVISRHVKNVFDEGELSAEATVAKSATVQREGEREVEYHNLDVIISVGYRVKSHRAPSSASGRRSGCDRRGHHAPHPGHAPGQAEGEAAPRGAVAIISCCSSSASSISSLGCRRSARVAAWRCVLRT